MPYSVILLEGAIKDIEEIYKHILKSGEKSAANNMAASLRKACTSLSENPERGHIPHELSKIDQFKFRQIVVKKYRIIYQIAEPNVFIFGIIHGNRNIGDVLRQRIIL